MIFSYLPYPPAWYLRDHRFFMEQYLLQAYLIGNSRLEVLMANNWLAYRHEDVLRAAFPRALYYQNSGSFWFKMRG